MFNLTEKQENQVATSKLFDLSSVKTIDDIENRAHLFLAIDNKTKFNRAKMLYLYDQFAENTNATIDFAKKYFNLGKSSVYADIITANYIDKTGTKTIFQNSENKEDFEFSTIAFLTNHYYGLAKKEYKKLNKAQKEKINQASYLFDFVFKSISLDLEKGVYTLTTILTDIKEIFNPKNITEESAIEESATEESATEESATEESATEESATEVLTISKLYEKIVKLCNENGFAFNQLIDYHKEVNN